MTGKRLLYTGLLLGAGMYYLASGEWLSWILLAVVLGVPWLSLLVSWKAIRQFSLSASCGAAVEMGEEPGMCLVGACPQPIPPFRGRLELTDCQTGEKRKTLSTEHCGGIRFRVTKARVCDYLGLFAFPARVEPPGVLVIRPRPVNLQMPEWNTAPRWHPVPGGGFSEDYELRPYRPGDSFAGIHWKLSAKTEALLLKEPMEAELPRPLLTLDWNGTPEERDRKLGRLLGLGRSLLSQKLEFELTALTGKGLCSAQIGTEPELLNALDRLLCSPLAEGSLESTRFPAAQRYHIGGNHEG